MPNHRTSKFVRPAKAIKGAATGSALWKKWGADELRKKIATLKALIGTGADDIAIAEQMGLTVGEYNSLKAEMYQWESADLSERSTEQVYVDYVARQTDCINQLDELIGEFKRTRQANAMVGAVRAKSDIIDRVLKTGQDMGLLEKAPEKKQIVGGFMIANLDNKALRNLIEKQLRGLGEVIAAAGGLVDMDGSPLPDSAPATLAPLPPPVSTAPGRPAFARGGAAKAAGGHATAVARARATTPPPPPGAGLTG